MEATGFEGKLMLNSDASPDRPLLRLSDEDSATYGGEHLACLLPRACCASAADKVWHSAPLLTRHPFFRLCKGWKCQSNASCKVFQVLARMHTVEWEWAETLPSLETVL